MTLLNLDRKSKQEKKHVVQSEGQDVASLPVRQKSCPPCSFPSLDARECCVGTGVKPHSTLGPLALSAVPCRCGMGVSFGVTST